MKKYVVEDIRQHFINELAKENFTTDKTGQRTIELLGASFIADEPAIFGTVNEEYVNAEIEWYNSHSTNINDIYEDKGPPDAWKYAANKYGEINSNYGKLISDKKYYRQFTNAASELIKNPDSRRAIMIYNRPSMWVEYNENGKNDFICTNAVTYYIRNNKLYVVVQMRSNDSVFGYKNDRAWAVYVQKKLLKLLNNSPQYVDNNLLLGDIHWQVQNLHVYERHFHLVK